MIYIINLETKPVSKQAENKQGKKAFLFIYPIPEYINQEIKNRAILFKTPYLKYMFEGRKEEAEELIKSRGEECEKEFREFYKEKINLCINLRYRQKGFSIIYALFDKHPMSMVVDLYPGDKVLRVGKDFASFNTKTQDGSNYPNPDLLLDKLTEFQTLRFGGFHLWDCVNRFAGRAYERGFDTLVDEDLTELFTSNILKKDFRLDIYPSIIYTDHFKRQIDMEEYLNARRGKPWFWQDYDKLLELPYFDNY